MNERLRSELLAMKEKDLFTRNRLIETGELPENEYHPQMKSVQIENNKRIKEIIQNYGWPLESAVGEDGAEACWLVVQHAVLEPEFQEHCINLLKQAIAKNDAKRWFLAYLQDRVLIHKGKPQLYGTQHHVVNGRMQPEATENPSEVNQRRSSLGLGSLEAHTASLQKKYDAIKANKTKHEV